jgi:hypothetical protein
VRRQYVSRLWRQLKDWALRQSPAKGEADEP